MLIVGDIDRGGVFASFVGTMEVLSERERALVEGFVVNRFRGQEALLAEAHAYVLRHTGRPVLGVVPYLRTWAPRGGLGQLQERLIDGRPRGRPVEIAVIDLPHISNFTDFIPCGSSRTCACGWSAGPAELGRPDAVILPGARTWWATWSTSDAAGWPSGSRRSPGRARRKSSASAAGSGDAERIRLGYPLAGIESASGRSLSGLGLLSRPDGARPGEDPHLRHGPTYRFGFRRTRL